MQARFGRILLACIGVLLLNGGALDHVLAQAPDSIGGRTIELVVTGGSGAFASSGTFRFLPSGIDGKYATVPIVGNIVASSGSYSYLKSSLTTATLRFDDDLLGPGFAANCTFNTTNGGIYTITNPAAPGTQHGTFSVFSGPAPVTIAGSTVTVTVTSGEWPFSSVGSALFLPASDGTYKITGLSGGIVDSAGTYTYQVKSPTTAAITLLDLEIGSEETKQLSFRDGSSGTYFIEGAGGGGFQTGIFSFTAPAAKPPHLSAVGLIGNQFRFTLAAEAGRSYTVESAPALGKGVWQVLVSIPAANGASNVVVTDTLAMGARYYRVRTP